MHPGIFCAFSSPEVEDTCSVRLYVTIAPHLTSLQPYPNQPASPPNHSATLSNQVMIAPKIAPYRASSVRVHLCPTLPDQLEEVELEEHCEWGLVKCAGTSQILRLPQGAAVVLEMDGEVHSLQWMGLRTHVAMMYDPRNRAKAQGKEGTKASKFSYDEVVTVKLAKGVGRRAALGRAQGIKAGIPEEGLKVPFGVDQPATPCRQPATPSDGPATPCRQPATPCRQPATPSDGPATRSDQVPFNVEVQHHTPPSPPLRLKLVSRTPKQFTLSWMPPKATGGAAVHHYAVELELLTNKGVRRGFKEVCEGRRPE